MLRRVGSRRCLSYPVSCFTHISPGHIEAWPGLLHVQVPGRLAGMSGMAVRGRRIPARLMPPNPRPAGRTDIRRNPGRLRPKPMGIGVRSPLVASRSAPQEWEKKRAVPLHETASDTTHQRPWFTRSAAGWADALF